MSAFTSMGTTRYALGVALALALVVVHTSRAAAQATQPGARMERIVIGDDGVLVVDATYLPSHARTDIALIRSVTDKPVRYLVISHLHRDHNGGASAYRDAFPGVAVVSGAQTRDFIAINRAATARNAAANGSPLRTALAALEARLAAGRDSAGQALTPAATARHRVGAHHGPHARAWPSHARSVIRPRRVHVDRRRGVPGSSFLGRGMTLDQIQQSVDVTRLRAGSMAWAGSGLDNDWTATVRALVERAWHELRGLD